MQVVDLLYMIVVEVQEDQVWQRHQVLDPCDQVMLQIEQSKSFFAFKQWHMTQFSLVQLESLRIGCPFTRLTIDDKDAWYLWQFGKNDLVLILDAPHNSIGQQVTIAFIIFTLMESYRQKSRRDQSSYISDAVMSGERSGSISVLD